eukprot:gene14335-biopygen8718
MSNRILAPSKAKGIILPDSLYAEHRADVGAVRVADRRPIHRAAVAAGRAHRAGASAGCNPEVREIAPRQRPSHGVRSPRAGGAVSAEVERASLRADGGADGFCGARDGGAVGGAVPRPVPRADRPNAPAEV